VVTLGGGRMRPGDTVDPRVGLAHVLPLGAPVAVGQPLAMLHAARVADVQGAVLAVQRAMQLGDEAPEVPPVVHEAVA
jgi:thymidine phosphorylase